MKTRDKCIDGLRGIACCGIVLLYHPRAFFFQSYPIWMDYMAYFVEIFFMISGYMMAKRYRARISTMSFKEYYIKRYIKLMSLYWVVFLVLILIKMPILCSTVVINYAENNLLTLLMDFFGCLSGWLYPYLGINSWFHSVLNLCYILFFLVVKASCFCGKKQQSLYYFSLYFLIILFCIGLERNWNVPFLYAGISLRGYIPFLVGVGMFEIYSSVNKLILQKLCIFLDGVCGLVLIWAYCNGIDFTMLLGNISLTMKILICPLLIMNILLFVPIKKFFENIVLSALGKISMDMYLWHTVVLHFVVRCIGTKFRGYIVFALATLVVGFVSNRFITPNLTRLILQFVGIYEKAES